MRVLRTHRRPDLSWRHWEELMPIRPWMDLWISSIPVCRTALIDRLASPAISDLANGEGDWPIRIVFPMRGR